MFGCSLDARTTHLSGAELPHAAGDWSRAELPYATRASPDGHGSGHKARVLCGEGRREAAPRLADGGRTGPAQLSGGRREKDGVARLAWWRKDGGGDGTSGGRMRSVEDGVRRA